MTRKADLNEIARQYVQARRVSREAKEMAEDLQLQILERLTEPKLIVDMGEGNSATLTLVVPVRVSWIAANVKKILPAKFWNRVKTEDVNRTILEAMISSGELAAYDLTEAREVKEAGQYLKVTEKPSIATAVPIIRKDIA